MQEPTWLTVLPYDPLYMANRTTSSDLWEGPRVTQDLPVLEPTTQDSRHRGVKAAEEVERYLTFRDNHAPTTLHALPALVQSFVCRNPYERSEMDSFHNSQGRWITLRLTASASLPSSELSAAIGPPWLRMVA